MNVRAMGVCGVVTVALGAGVLACSSDAAPGGSGATGATTTAAAGTTGAAATTGSPAMTGSAASTGAAPAKGPAGKTELPPIGEPSLQKGTLRGKEVTAVICKLDTSAPVMGNQDFEQALPALAAAPDGTLYVVDHENKLRHYKNTDPAGCDLVLDTAFGQGGVMDFGSRVGGSSYGVAVDAAGTVYYTTGGIGTKTKKIVGGKAADWCEGWVRATSTSSTVLIGKYIANGNECSAKAVDFKGYPDSAKVYALGVLDGELLASRSEDEKEGGKEVRHAGIHSMDGAQKLKLGKKDGDESMWTIGGAKMCSGDICVFVRTLGSAGIRVWSKDGKFVGKLDLASLGVDMKAVAMDVAPQGLWFGGAMSRKEGPGYAGAIVRVKGI